MRAGDCLFEPALETLHAKGLSMADAVVEVKDGGGMNLIISNRGREPVLLEEGEVLGELHTAKLLEKCDPQSGEPEDDRQGVSQLVASVRGDGCGGREKEVITALDLDSAGLQPAEMEQLRSLVAEFADLFVLDSTELGRTSITTHEINTGDSHHAVILSPYGARWIPL